MTSLELLLTTAVILAFIYLKMTTRPRCKHPFDSLTVEQEHEVLSKDEDFTNYEYYFRCGECKHIVIKRVAVLNKPVEDFLKEN